MDRELDEWATERRRRELRYAEEQQGNKKRRKEPKNRRPEWQCHRCATRNWLDSNQCRGCQRPFAAAQDYYVNEYGQVMSFARCPPQAMQAG